MIAVVDYGRGNLFSIGQALRHLGAAYSVENLSDNILGAERVILPGVGAFGDAMRTLRERQLVEPLKAVAARGTPLLGICLGMQMLATRSEEFGSHEGLDLIPATVRRLPDGTIRIPNVGWRSIVPNPENGYLADLATETMVYFVHSLVPLAEASADVAATVAVNGIDAAAVIRRGNVVGYQFHPEKSGAAGFDLIRRFLDLPTA